ncbi:MAG: hypothetical protein J6328_02005, partial [Bacilli bacterium]|nr:hypothetical protein [Bacilli bacterium]
ELATNWVKMDFKNNGDLSAYPDFKKINITLSMKKDFTPTSYRIEATYDASRAIIGTTEVKQESACLFSSVNEGVTIPNESFLAEKLGAKPSELVTDDEERSIRNDLGKAAMNLDLKGGVATEGTLTLTLSDALSMDLDIEANAFIDLEKITKENVYGSLGLHANLEADEYFGSLISLVRGIAGDNLGPAADVLEDFKSLEVIYDNEGSFYLIPTNSEDKVKSVQKAKLTDLLDMVLKNVDVSTIIAALQSDGERDTFDFKKTPGANSASYTVEITLTEEAKSSIKDTLNTFFENEDYAIIKTLISYKDFHDIKIAIEVKDDKLAGVDGAISYVKEGALGLSEEIADILELHLDIKEEKYDFAERLEYAEELYGAYLDCAELKARLETLLDNPYVSNGYLIDLENAYAEYLALSEQERYFVGDNIPGRVETVKKNVTDVIGFIKIYGAYDLNGLDNDDILALAKAYYANRLDGNLLKAEIGEEDFSIINNLGDHVDYTIFDSALPKLTGNDEDTWGLDEEEIKGIKTILDIAQHISSVNGRILLSLLLNGNAMSVEDLSAKIDNLYNGLE